MCDFGCSKDECEVMLYSATPLVCITPPTEGFPWDDLRKILPGCQQMAIVPNGVETLAKILIAWVGCTNVTDRQTTNGRQTDGRRHIANVNMSSRSLKGQWLDDIKRWRGAYRPGWHHRGGDTLIKVKNVAIFDKGSLGTWKSGRGWEWWPFFRTMTKRIVSFLKEK